MKKIGKNVVLCLVIAAAFIMPISAVKNDGKNVVFATEITVDDCGCNTYHKDDIFYPVRRSDKEDFPDYCLINNNDIDEYIIDFMDRRNIPGLSAGIVKSDEIVWKNAYGYANIEENIKVENTTLFRIASVSKTITGTALMQLYEQDYFELNDPINDYLPFRVDNPNYDTDITFLMLVTHTSSIRDNWDYIPTYVGDSPLSLGYYLEEYFTPGGSFYSSSDNFYNREPGESFDYCNVAIGLVAYLVEVISGMPFDEYCQMYIFDPLEMYETSWFLKDLDVNNIAIPYGDDFEPYPHFGHTVYPAGQLRTSSPQLCNFIISMLNNGTFKSNSILRGETVDIIFTPHSTSIPWADSIGIIWWGYRGGSYWAHIGSSLGGSTEIRIYPSEEIGIIVLTNGESDIQSLTTALYKYGKEITNEPPNRPNINGPSSGKPRIQYEYTFNCVDPNGDDVYYYIDWGDNSVEEWIGANASGEEVIVAHTWDEKGDYIIKVKAKDVYDAESEWTTLEVSMPKTYENPLYTLIEKLFDWLGQLFEREILPGIFNF